MTDPPRRGRARGPIANHTMESSSGSPRAPGQRAARPPPRARRRRRDHRATREALSRAGRVARRAVGRAPAREAGSRAPRGCGAPGAPPPSRARPPRPAPRPARRGARRPARSPGDRPTSSATGGSTRAAQVQNHPAGGGGRPPAASRRRPAPVAARAARPPPRGAALPGGGGPPGSGARARGGLRDVGVRRRHARHHRRAGSTGQPTGTVGPGGLTARAAPGHASGRAGERPATAGDGRERWTREPRPLCRAGGVDGSDWELSDVELDRRESPTMCRGLCSCSRCGGVCDRGAEHA
jgi:hypothetical protein